MSAGKARMTAHAGIIAAVYGVLTLVMIQNPLGYGPVQFRLSEAVTVVACLTSAAVPGLWLGAVIANSFMIAQLGALALFDVVLGSSATLVGAWWTWRHRERPLVALAGPVVANAIIVPAYLPIMLKGLGLYTVPFLGIDLEGAWIPMYLFGMVTVGIGQAVVVYGLGLPLLRVLQRLGIGGMTERDR